MSRKALAVAASTIALVLIAAGALTLTGSRYISGNVHDQLASQRIAFAPKGSPGLPADIQSYGGTAVTNGGQAKVFADKYIASHIAGSIADAAKTDPRVAGLTTYSELSSLARTDPTDAKLSALVDTVFRGEMLRSSLLSAWGWGTMASIMFWFALAALAAGILSALAAAALVPAVATRLRLSRPARSTDGVGSPG